MSTVITILIAVLVFGAIIFFHELGHFTVAKLCGIQVDEFAIGMGPVLFRKKKNGTVYSIRALPVGGFVAMEGENETLETSASFSQKSVPKKLAVIAAGSFANLAMGYLILVALVIMNGYVGTTNVVKFNENSVSEGVLQAGDKIVKINGHRVRTSNDITYEFLRDRDGLIELTVNRGGETISLQPIQFNMVPVDDEINAIEIDFKVAAVPMKPLDAVTYPVNWGIWIVKQVWGSLIDLLTGRYTLNQLSGPVGVATAIGEASKQGLDTFLLMAAFIAINIGVFNLLPFPVLDGGKLVQIVIEGIIRRPIPDKVIGAINAGGIVLLIGLMLFATYNDIARLLFGA